MNVREILSRVSRFSALVVGDVCLDRWCTYDPALADPSRETGLPRIAVVRTEVTPGAAGTVANNLKALGAGRVSILGPVGGDGFGFELRRALRERGIEDNLLIEVPGMQTFTYTKLLNATTGLEDLPRVDFLFTQPVEERMIEALRESASGYDVILVSDQSEVESAGSVTEGVRKLLGDLAASDPSRVVWADSRLRIERFGNGIIKCNREEADAACRRLGFERDYNRLRRASGARSLLVTHGPEGVFVADDSGGDWVKTKPVKNPVDICGAGDSFSAGAALALAATGSLREAAAFGNLVASVTIMKPGTGTASPQEVIETSEEI